MIGKRFKSKIYETPIIKHNYYRQVEVVQFFQFKRKVCFILQHFQTVFQGTLTSLIRFKHTFICQIRQLLRFWQNYLCVRGSESCVHFCCCMFVCVWMGESYAFAGTKAYSEPSKLSRMQLFVKTVIKLTVLASTQIYQQKSDKH